MTDQQSPKAGSIFPGRYTGRYDGSFVVFLIGFRVNKLWAFHKWMPVGLSMIPMIRELAADPDSGFLGTETMFYRRGVAFIQYWRSYEDIHAYARLRSGKHPAAWKAFNKNVGSDGTVGIWHESYFIDPGKHEGVYNNMPAFGLGAAVDHVPATGELETAKGRLGIQDEPLYPSPEVPDRLRTTA